MAIHDEVGETSRKGLCSGVYVKGMVESVPVFFTADTGASRTIISTRVFNKIRESARPELTKSVCLKGAGGVPIKERGKASFVLQLGPLEITCEAIVAEIEDDALLGYDVLVGGESGPADILLSKDKILLDGHEIPCIKVGRDHRVRKVIMAGDVIIPAASEAVVDAYVERIGADDLDDRTDYLVEPTEHFKETYQLMMASTLVNINRTTTCKVRVLNPYPTDMVLKQDAEIGKAERIERVVSVVQGKEQEDEENNYVPARRVSTNEDSSVKLSPPPYKAKESDVPQHIKQHMKQRPRRFPLAYAEEEKAASEDLLKTGVIQKCTSLVPKRGFLGEVTQAINANARAVRNMDKSMEKMAEAVGRLARSMERIDERARPHRTFKENSPPRKGIKSVVTRK